AAFFGAAFLAAVFVFVASAICLLLHVTFTTQHFVHTAATAGSNHARAFHFLEGFQSGFHHVVRVGRPDGFRHNVLDTQYFKYSAQRTAGDDTCTRFGRAHADLATTKACFHVMVQCAAFA